MYVCVSAFDWMDAKASEQDASKTPNVPLADGGMTAKSPLK